MYQTLLAATSVPAGHKTIGNIRVYEVKGDNSHKGRVVVLEDGANYRALIAAARLLPSAGSQSTRMVLTIAAELNLECWQLDYNTAFLNADVTDEVYVKMAPEYEQFDENGVSLVMRLLKSLSGFRQSPTNWWNTIEKHRVDIGFKSLISWTRASTPTRSVAPFISWPCMSTTFARSETSS